MMPPHPDTVFALQAIRHQELLAEAARERLADEAAGTSLTPFRIDGVRAAVNRMLAWFAAGEATVRCTRRPLAPGPCRGFGLRAA